MSWILKNNTSLLLFFLYYGENSKFIYKQHNNDKSLEKLINVVISVTLNDDWRYGAVILFCVFINKEDFTILSFWQQISVLVMEVRKGHEFEALFVTKKTEK